MTILVTTYVQEGIVMAADSRSTITHENDGKIEKYTHSDNMMKLFLLEKLPIGISSSGKGFDQPNSKIIQDFEEQYLNENDSLENVAIKLMSYLQEKNFEMKVHMCGYYEKEPFVYLIDRYSCQRFNYDEVNTKPSYNTLWSGHGEAISNLLLGNYPTNINFQIMPLKDAIDLAEFLVDVVIKRDHFNDNISTCGGPIDILVLTPEKSFFYRHKIYNPRF